jgi:hypothetical protein
MDATLSGYSWLPRMIDKARAARAGTLGGYFRYPCPIDAECLFRLGIDAEAFADVATAHGSDEDVLARLLELGLSPRPLSTFDPVLMNRRLHVGGS